MYTKRLPLDRELEQSNGQSGLAIVEGEAMCYLQYSTGDILVPVKTMQGRQCEFLRVRNIAATYSA